MGNVVPTVIDRQDTKERQGRRWQAGPPMTDRFPKERRGSQGQRAPEVLRTDTAPEDRQGPGGQTGAPRTGRGPEDRQGHKDRQGL